MHSTRMFPSLRRTRLALAAGSLLGLPAWANHGGPVTGAPQTIIIQGGHYDNAVGAQVAAGPTHRSGYDNAY